MGAPLLLRCPSPLATRPALTTPTRRSAEPLPRAISLLTRGVDHPLLRVRVHDFRSDSVEPLRRDLRVSHPSPQLADEIGEHRALIPRHAIEALQCFLEFPPCLTTEEPLRFNVSFVNAAPRRTQQQVRDVPRLHTLPVSDFRGGLVLLRARHRSRCNRGSELVPHALLEHW